MEFSVFFNPENFKEIVESNRRSLNNIYKDYFQKSKVFLYPLLNIKKGVQFVPDETYMSWKDIYDIKDCQFICIYKLNPKKPNEFRNFELKYIKTNRLFRHSVNLGNNTVGIVFDFSKYKNDIKRMINGEYSKISKITKEKILDFFGDKGTIAEYIESYLYPTYWHEDYANILNVSLSCIEDVHELCDKPDLKKECFNKISPEMKLFKQNIISLQS
jgi:hypothetical protein